MKHTNVLMKIRPPANKEEELQNKQERTERLNLLSTKLRLVQDLATTEGWKFFLSELREEKLKMLAMIERANEPTTLAKVTGSLLVIESFMDWTGDMSRQFEAMANDINSDNDD